MLTNILSNYSQHSYPHPYSSNILSFKFYKTSIVCFFPDIQNSNPLPLATHLISKLTKNLHYSKFKLLELLHFILFLSISLKKHCLFLPDIQKYPLSLASSSISSFNIHPFFKLKKNLIK